MGYPEQREAHDTTVETPYSGVITAFDSLLAIGSLYPPEHVRCREIANKFIGEWEAAMPSSQALHLRVGEDELFLGPAKIGLDSPAAKRVHGILSSVAADWMTIAPGMSSQDLLSFASRLVEIRHQVVASRSLHQIEFSCLPKGINLHQREFGGRVTASSTLEPHVDHARAAMQRISRSLESENLTEEQRSRLRNLAEETLSKLIERVEKSPSNPTFTTTGNKRTLDEVLVLGAQAVQKAMGELVQSHANDTTGILSILEATEQALALSDDRETVELLTKILRDMSDELGETACDDSHHDLKTNEDEHELSVIELCEALGAWALPDVDFDFAELEDRSLYLSILLDTVFVDSGPVAHPKISQILVEELATPLDCRERELLRGTLQHQLERVSETIADRSLPILLKVFRHSESESAAVFLRDVCDGASERVLEIAWPHITNEILIGLDGLAPGISRSLHRLVALAPPKSMREGIPRLNRLEAIASGRLSERVFCPPINELYSVYESLLFSDRGDIIGSLLLRAFKSSAPRIKGTKALCCISDYSRTHQALMVEFLRSIASGQASEKLTGMLGRIVVSTLSTLPQKRRREDWIPTAIETLCDPRIDGVRSVLVEIMRARHFFLFPIWPKACRRAAREALKALDSAGAEDSESPTRTGVQG